MSREKQPNQRKASRAHHERTDQLVERIIDQLSIGATEEAMRLISLVDLSRVDEFRFRDFPTFKRLVEEMKRSYAQRLRLGLISAQKSEWDESWAMQDLLVSKALRSYGINGKQGGKIEISLSEQRDSALRSFLKRREQGVNLSERVWDLSSEHQTLLERSIATALKHGSSFAQLSREVLRYLRDYPRLESEYRQAFGKKLDIGNIRYQAQRLARTEINMAYRSAESSRWQELDFVVGYEVKRSQRNERRKVKDPKTGRTKTVVINSDCPVCDALKGRYPKDFKWTAWHPNCRCYAVPILSSREDFLRGEDPKKSANAVTELPQGFKDWVKDNEGRIATASHRGTLPYFLRDNASRFSWIASKGENGRYINDTTFGERLLVSTLADSNDIKDNIRVSKTLLKSFPDMRIKIRPHIRGVKGHKNPELKINGLIADNKRIESERGVSNAFKSAIKQGCSALVLDLDASLKKLNIEKLSKGISDRKTDFKTGTIKYCYVVFEGKAVAIDTHDRNMIRGYLETLQKKG